MKKKPQHPPAQWPTTQQQYWPIEKIKPYPNNPRTHPPEQITLLATLMLKYGVDQPIVVDEKGEILKGHGRRMAAVEAGFDTYPIVMHRGLKEEDKRAIRIADNQVGLLSGWSDDLLREELAQLSMANFDMPLLGFSNSQLAEYTAAAPTGKDPEVTPEPPKTPVSRLGDMWLLGKHQVLCGDATKAKDVARVLGKNKPGVMITDPPYGVEYDANWRNERIKAGMTKALGKVENDDRADWREAWALFPGNVVYCWHASLHTTEVVLSFRAVGFELRSHLVWNKGRMIIGRGDYHWQHEPCCYLIRKGASAGWTGDRSQTTIWDITHRASETGHSTQKPVECMRRPMANNTEPGVFVYDPFLGSGTTVIAAEIMARNCLGLELNPRYVDVIITRWEKFTGKSAKLAGDGRTFAQIGRTRKNAPRRASAGHTEELRADPAE